MIDFRTKLRKSSVKKIFDYFIEEKKEEEAVLVGYVSNVIGKLFEVSSSEIMDYLQVNKDHLQGLLRNVGHYSVANLLVMFLGENFVIQEKKNEGREELLTSGNLEASYGKGFDSRSKNKLFRDSSENMFEHQKKEILEKLEEGKLLLIKDIIKEEIQDYQDKMSKSKLMIIETFKELLKFGRMEPEMTSNVMRVVYEVLGKFLDAVCEEVGIKGVNTYMNRMNR